MKSPLAKSFLKIIIAIVIGYFVGKLVVEIYVWGEPLYRTFFTSGIGRYLMYIVPAFFTTSVLLVFRWFRSIRNRLEAFGIGLVLMTTSFLVDLTFIIHNSYSQMERTDSFLQYYFWAFPYTWFAFAFAINSVICAAFAFAVIGNKKSSELTADELVDLD